MNFSSSNNTNKLSPQELFSLLADIRERSNNTNKLSPQEQLMQLVSFLTSSNNTNKLSPQELSLVELFVHSVQIIQINLVLKNW